MCLKQNEYLYIHKISNIKKQLIKIKYLHKFIRYWSLLLVLMAKKTKNWENSLTSLRP